MTSSTAAASRSKTLDMAYIALFTVLIAVCAWIPIPTLVPFTLQTFGIFLATAVLGGKRGSLAVAVYLLLGAVGVPVFANFTSGLGMLLGVTGGYLVGFLFIALVMWAMERLLGKKRWVLVVSMVLGLAVCYAFGTAWFMIAYANTTGPIGLGAALWMCVIPYLIPDGIKLLLAVLLSRRLSAVLKL